MYRLSVGDAAGMLIMLLLLCTFFSGTTIRCCLWCMLGPVTGYHSAANIYGDRLCPVAEGVAF